MKATERKKPILTISMSRDNIRLVEAEAEKLGIDRSAMVNVCISQYFRNIEAMSLLAKANDLMEQVKLLQDSQQITFAQVQNND